MHGMARVWVKDYAAKRNREIRASRPVEVSRQNDGKGLRDLARDMGQFGMSRAIHAEPSKDGPLH